MDDIPKNPIGKILRKELRNPVDKKDAKDKEEEKQSDKADTKEEDESEFIRSEEVLNNVAVVSYK